MDVAGPYIVRPVNVVPTNAEVLHVGFAERKDWKLALRREKAGFPDLWHSTLLASPLQCSSKEGCQQPVNPQRLFHCWKARDTTQGVPTTGT